MKVNNEGFIRFENGVLVETSNRSALSGDKLGTGCYTIPVEGHPGLRFRVNASEYLNLTPEQKAQIVAKAKQFASVPAPSKKKE